MVEVVVVEVIVMSDEMKMVCLKLILFFIKLEEIAVADYFMTRFFIQLSIISITFRLYLVY